jgi:hypothetical protein
MLRSLFAFLALWLAFDFLFWHQTPGINYLLFSILVIAILLWRNPGAWKRKTVLLSGALTIISSTMVALHGPGWAVVATIFSLIVFPAFVMQEKFRSVITAFLQGIVNLFMGLGTALMRWTNYSGSSKLARRAGFLFKVLLLPLLVAIVFFTFYAYGNPHFAALFSGIISSVEDFFRHFSVARFLFLLLGCLNCGGCIVLVKAELEQRDASPDSMMRVRKKNNFQRGMIALRRETQVGMVMLVLLNLLLLTVNIIDISRVWNQFVVPVNFSLKRFVHDGTWTLSISVLLSMIVLLWLFRGNMHFYKKNKLLKLLAYAWIGQNIFLSLSLFKRTYHYISFHGLAYGRIAVIACLVLLIFGLITFIIKIKKDKSVFFLQRINSWSAYFMIVALSLVNWDEVIVNYNLHHSNPGQIDVDFYLQVRPDVFPLIYENKELVEKQMEAHKKNAVTWVNHLDPGFFWREMNQERSDYRENHGNWKWPSWNRADDRALDWMDIH